MLCVVTGSTQYAAVGWFIANSTYFMALFRYYSGKNSSNKKPILYAGYVSAFCYPFLTGWSISWENLITEGNIHLTALLLHYLSLGLLVLLEYMTIKRIYLRNTGKKVNVKQIIQGLTVLLLVFVSCIEYDNIMLIIQSVVSAGNRLNASHFDSNQFLPYTVIMWIISASAFIYGTAHKMTVFKISALVLFMVAVIKFFTFDFQVLDAGQSSLILIILGIALIVIAMIYLKLNTRVKISSR